MFDLRDPVFPILCATALDNPERGSGGIQVALFKQSSRRCADLFVEGQRFARDANTNATPSILAKVPQKLLHQPAHPLGILRTLIEQQFPNFTSLLPNTPAVTVFSNFDELGFPKDHPGRAATDSYYLNASHMLRTHTSAHEVEVFRQGTDRWLLSADVYRRDEIDRSHYPVFHQMEAAYVLPRSQVLSVMGAENRQMEAEQIENLKNGRIIIEDETHGGTEVNPWQPEHLPAMEETLVVDKSLKLHLNRLALAVFGKGLEARGKTDEPLRIRWLEDVFPFTSPSYQLEVWFEGKWLEILGCGIVKQHTLNQAGMLTVRIVSSDVAHHLNRCTEQDGLGLWSGTRSDSYDPLRHPRHPSLLVSRSSLCLSVLRRQIDHLPALFKISSMLQRHQLLGARGLSREYFLRHSSRHSRGFGIRCTAGKFFIPTRPFQQPCQSELTAFAQIDRFVHPKTQRRSLCYRIHYQSMDRNLLNEEVNDLQALVVDAVVQGMRIEVR